MRRRFYPGNGVVIDKIEGAIFDHAYLTLWSKNTQTTRENKKITSLYDMAQNDPAQDGVRHFG